EELNRIYPGVTASRVEILLKSGERLTRQVDIPLGDPRVPMGEKEVAEKLRAFAGTRDKEKIDRIIALTLGLENIADINELTKLI
ncbi:MAG: hypothetical protein PHY31_07805, partial [Smithellaceae bacterium]|nr:hypothetical protein [Smithellaceae bacterium]